MNKTVFNACILIAFCMVWHGEAQDTPDEKPKSVFCQSLDWSRDNKLICFSAIVQDSGKYEKDRWELYAINADGTNLRRLTHNSADDSWPSFSPDGKKITFASDRDGKSQIYVMNADGSSQTRVTQDTTLDTSPTWSPDGKSIVFASNRDGNEELYSMKIHGTDQERLTTTQYNEYNPQFSPKGNKVTYYVDRGDHKDQVYVLELGSGITRNICNDTLNNIYPAWSSDGKSLIFSTQLDTARGICTVDPNKPEARLKIAYRYFLARMSRDGKHVALIGGGWPNSRIDIAKSDGSDIHTITNRQALIKLSN